MYNEESLQHTLNQKNNNQVLVSISRLEVSISRAEISVSVWRNWKSKSLGLESSDLGLVSVSLHHCLIYNK